MTLRPQLGVLPWSYTSGLENVAHAVKKCCTCPELVFLGQGNLQFISKLQVLQKTTALPYIVISNHGNQRFLKYFSHYFRISV